MYILNSTDEFQPKKYILIFFFRANHRLEFLMTEKTPTNVN